MKAMRLIYKFVFSLIVCILCIHFLSSCSMNLTVRIDSNSSNENSNNLNEAVTTTFVYDVEQYPLSEGADSADGMKAALKLNGKYYEGKEYYCYWVSYGDKYHAGNEIYSDIMDNAYYPHSIKEIPEGCPIIKLSREDTYELISEHHIRYHYFMDFSGYSQSINEYQSIPTEPGIYLLVAVTDDIQGIPWFSETFVKPETYTEYALSYQYVFAVIVE